MINRRKHCRTYKKVTNKSSTLKEKGKLSVKIINKFTKEPVTFVSATVYLLTFEGLYSEHGTADLVARHITDENGKIPIIELPVIDRVNSHPSTQYYMTVNHFRYHPVNLMNIQIYPNITTDYDVHLTPITSPHPDYEFLITPEHVR